MFIGIDIGSSFLKMACIGDEISCIEKYRPVRIYTPDTSCHEYDVQDIFLHIKDYIDRHAESDIDGIIFSTQMHGFVLYNHSTKTGVSYVSWQDERSLEISPSGKSYIDMLKGSLLPSQLSGNGVKIKPELALCNLFTLAKMNNDFKKQDLEFFTLGSYIIFRLTGNNITHITNAAPTGMYDIRDNKWNEAAFSTLEIKNLKLPTVTDKNQVCGFYKDIPIYPDYGDHQVSILGAGIDLDTININIGTASQISSVCKEFTLGYMDSVYEIRPFFDGNYIKTITKLCGGRSLQVLIDFFGNVVSTLTGREPSSKEIWDIIDKLPHNGDGTLRVKTGFFETLLFNVGSIENINSRNLNIASVMQGAYEDMAGVFNGMLSVIDPEKNKKRIVFSSGIGKTVSIYMKNLSPASGYKFVCSDTDNNIFLGLKKLFYGGVMNG